MGGGEKNGIRFLVMKTNAAAGLKPQCSGVNQGKIGGGNRVRRKESGISSRTNRGCTSEKKTQGDFRLSERAKHGLDSITGVGERKSQNGGGVI